MRDALKLGNLDIGGGMMVIVMVMVMVMMIDGFVSNSDYVLCSHSKRI